MAFQAMNHGLEARATSWAAHNFKAKRLQAGTARVRKPVGGTNDGI